MRIAKQALHTVSQQLSPNTQVGLYVFGGGSNTGWLYELGPLDGQRLKQSINRAKPSGRTPLGATLMAGANALLQQRETQLGYGTYRLLVVTDGEASDSALMERVIPQVLARGITLDAIGLDMEGDHSLATKVHNYRRADDQASLTQAIAASFAEVSEDEQQNLEQWFAELEGLDPAIAMAAIGAFANSGNDAITPNRGGGSASSGASSTQTIAGQSGGQVTQVSTSMIFSGSPVTIIMFVVSIIIFSVIIRGFKR